MSGHSHYSTIKHKKAASDAKRSKMFSKLSCQISFAAKEGGEPEKNSALKLAIDQAKRFNMPKNNIERAIKRGTGELKGEILENVTLEAYGQGGAAIIIEGITDNRKRFLGEIKQIISQNNGKLTKEGAIRWMFDKKGCIAIDFRLLPPDMHITTKEELEMLAIESGAQETIWNDNILFVYTESSGTEHTKRIIEKRGMPIESVSIDWVPKEIIEISQKDKDACEKLFGALDENDAVQEIYSNLKIKN